MTTSRGVVVVGASAAGLAAAEGLRHAGYEGPLTLIGGEPHPPYDRPPLSKQLLVGDWLPERLRLRPPEAYEGLDVRLRLGIVAQSLDISSRRVQLADGTEVAYDSLVVATGCEARVLPGSRSIAGVHTLRTLEDALSLRAALRSHPHLVVVGGGFVGAEAASAARSLGCEVTLVTGGGGPLAGAVGHVLADMLAEVHLEHGVRLVTRNRVAGLVTVGGRATGVRLATGRVLPADAVLLGVGARPGIRWLAGSGLPLVDGVACDSRLYAGHGVWAAGDVASWRDAATGERLRTEHRTNATEQGLTVARNILAGPASARVFQAVPYVWSDQYDLKVQMYGRPRDGDTTHVVEGSPERRRYTAVHVREGNVVAVHGVNMFRRLSALRALVADRSPWPPPESRTTPVGDSVGTARLGKAGIRMPDRRPS